MGYEKNRDFWSIFPIILDLRNCTIHYDRLTVLMLLAFLTCSTFARVQKLCVLVMYLIINDITFIVMFSVGLLSGSEVRDRLYSYNKRLSLNLPSLEL